MWFNSTQDFMNSVSGPAGAQVMVDTQEHLTNVQMLHADGETIVPFDRANPASNAFCRRHVNYKPSFGTRRKPSSITSPSIPSSRPRSRGCADII